MKRAVLAVALLLLVTPALEPTSSHAQGEIVRIAAAGDIACDPYSDPNFNQTLGANGYCHMRQTSDLLLSGSYDAVLALGDNQYENGAHDKYLASFDPTWGRIKSLIRPVAGNHNHRVVDAQGYRDYFGSAAVNGAGKTYYSYNLGDWHLIALDSNCKKVGGCSSSSGQAQWLKSDLAAHSNFQCTLAYFHHPRFASDQSGTPQGAFWNILYNAKADVILNGHVHRYERFAPQQPNGSLDATNGIAEFIVGTGGKNLNNKVLSPRTNSVANQATDYGVLEMTLQPGAYEFRFVPEAGGSYSDSGSHQCH
jgi:hypothetical protein